RQADPRIALEIRAALGNAARVVNVGAGAGSYEPSDLDVVAVEPSWEMIRQRPPSQRPAAVQAQAERLPFPDGAFAAALAQLPAERVDRGLGRLADDLRTKRWEARFGHLRSLDSADLGYRLVVAEPGARGRRRK